MGQHLLSRSCTYWFCSTWRYIRFVVVIMNNIERTIVMKGKWINNDIGKVTLVYMFVVTLLIAYSGGMTLSIYSLKSSCLIMLDYKY